MMQRYEMEILVRGNVVDGWRDDETQITAVNVTASSELSARRMVLERAWGNGLLVTRFNSIKKTAKRV
jgi:hypothetical protein